jgi:hypothetical protein
VKEGRKRVGNVGDIRCMYCSMSNRDKKRHYTNNTTKGIMIMILHGESEWDRRGEVYAREPRAQAEPNAGRAHLVRLAAVARHAVDANFCFGWAAVA